MIHKPDLTHQTRDSLGKTPDLSLMGRQYRHSGNGKIYQLTDYVWCGESDRWMFVMNDAKNMDTAVPIARPLEHLDGYREDGSRRYVSPRPPIGSANEGFGRGEG